VKYKTNNCYDSGSHIKYNSDEISVNGGPGLIRQWNDNAIYIREALK